MSNFSFSHSFFIRLVLQKHKNQGLFGKGLKNLQKKPVKNIVREEENNGNQHFLLLSQYFLPYQKLI